MANRDSSLRLAILIASTRQGRFAPTVARWFDGEARKHKDFAVDLIDLADVALPQVLGETPCPEATATAARLDNAEAFVVVTPEYNHSFPAPLKNFIDWHNKEWQAKPVGFVSYGGRSGGLRAVEQLRQIFAELHAVTVRDTVSFHDAWSNFDSDGQPTNRDAFESAARSMLHQILWWGRALRDAKLTRPFGSLS
jgi:NAD(P)H-dependent FMN reductase